jgi:uncharacterized protein YebE (UPF0316 family)
MPEMLASVLLIFSLRVLNNAIGTVRVISLAYGRRFLAFILAFLESLTFAVTAGQVLTNLNNLPNLMAYTWGFAVGGYVGMYIENRFVKGYKTLNIVANENGHALAQTLRERGYGVTETTGQGASGQVTIIRSVLTRQSLSQALDIIEETNPRAFVTIEEALSIRRGWFGRENGA